MLNNLFSFFLARNVYVRVRRNQFQIHNLESGFEATVIARAPFTTTRLLIGQFVAAQNTLKEALKQESKDRIFREVAVGAGASKVVVWFGHELNDAEVKEKLRIITHFLTFRLNWHGVISA